jgi:hypothetical protein
MVFNQSGLQRKTELIVGQDNNNFFLYFFFRKEFLKNGKRVFSSYMPRTVSGE